MTGLCTDNFRTPNYAVAAGALLRLANVFLTEVCMDRARDNEAAFLELWKVLRVTAEKLTHRRALELDVSEFYLLRRTLLLLPEENSDVVFLKTLNFTERG